MPKPANNQPWYVYLLRRVGSDDAYSTGKGSRELYVGMSNAIERRVERHNNGEVRATRGQQWRLEAYAVCSCRAEAATLERWLKTGDTRKKRKDFSDYLGLDKLARTEASNYFIRRALAWDMQKELRKGMGVEIRRMRKVA